MSADRPAASRRMVNVVIDGSALSVPEGTLVVEAAKLAGTSVPVYCYHPKMDPVGLCRICLVEIEKTPKLQIACATRVTEGMVVHTSSERVAQARNGVLEFLLLNHPLDCPICDKGGECDLQDFTMSYGPGLSRLTEPKLHKPKRVDLGPTIVLDEERCILCRRCTRFDDEIAQERNLVVIDRGHRSLIGTSDGGPYRSYFSGNTTEICPVGALTSKAYRFRARPWDLTHADSVCAQCSVGCNFRIDSRFGRIMRTFTRENLEIDDGWICDRGRYTFNYLYEPTRLRRPLMRRGDDLAECSLDDAAALCAEKLGPAARAGRVGVIGGGRLSDEEAFALQAFARQVLGTNNIDYRVHLQKFASPARFGARLIDIDDASLVLMFGAYTPEQAPILDLRLRRAVARHHTQLMYIGPYRPHLPVEAQYVEYTPGAIADLMMQLADTVHQGRTESGDGFVADIARRLAQAEKIIAVHNGRDPASVSALDRLLETLAGYNHRVGVLVVGSQGNARGAEAAGCVPNLGPGYAPCSGEAGMTTGEMLKAAADGALDALFIAGANPALTFADGALARRALENVPFLAVAEQVLTETAALADIVFPTASFAEKRGHVTNLEGRRQAFGQAVEPPVDVLSDAEIIALVARAMGHAESVSPQPAALLAGLVRAESAAERSVGDLLPRAKVDAVQPAAVEKVDATHRTFTIIPVPHLYSGGGAVAHDPGTAPMRPRPYAIVNPEDAARVGVVPGERLTLSGSGGSIDVEARVGPQAPVGVALVLADMPEAPANKLLDASGFGTATISKAASVPEQRSLERVSA
ncbi:MAG: NADH-quinone oxidoreductase subunit NuoG [Candidatus Eremiobacteraeota bacterium]|nr:NADH-quinone oxidoreductase subunit NuoG [Candidatus Eremiobacteraeota bacterium]MBC5826844.1 NADH-quinone oxidoreductase subunit NuoG [Candidatus Eremiobacteraeota bacterium]